MHGPTAAVARSQDDVAACMTALGAHLDGHGAAEWQQALDLFLTPEWIVHLAAEGFVGAIRPWLPMLVDDEAGAALLLPLLQTDAGLRSLSNYYCSLYGAVGHGVPGPASWKRLAQSLRVHPQGDVVDLQPLSSDAAWLPALEYALIGSGYWIDRYFCFGNWYLPVDGAGFDAYFSARPSTLRHSIERGRRRLQRCSHELTIHCGPGPALDAAIAAFEEVYQRSWKHPEPSPRFMPGLMRLAAAKGWLRLGVLWLDGQPIASQVWLVKSGKANIYKLAYAQGFERFSPGSVLTAALMAHVMDVDHVCEVDYLTGDDAYKRDWMSARRERIGLVAFHPLSLRGLLMATRHFSGRIWRRWRAAAGRA